jgi:hypothetical protein
MKPTPEQLEKLLTLVGVLPVLADYMEDLNGTIFTKQVKNKCNMLLAEIRRIDNIIMQGTEIGIIEEQHNIGLAFRNWQKENFKDKQQIT